MKEGGYRAKDPRDASELAGRRFGDRWIDAAPSAAEVRMADWDGKCQDSTGVVPAYEAALIAAASRWIQTYKDAILQADAWRQQADESAAAILAS
jgi:hypothetical protein